MAGFRRWKERLARELSPDIWPVDAPEMPPALAGLDAPEAVSPLLSFLPRGGVFMWRAVLVLGRVVPAMAERDMESARTVMRRCMWHMNEDSGNMGWGIAETMGEITARSPAIAAEFGKIVVSYANDTGKADNYIDFLPLRRGVYWAIGRAAPALPALHAESFQALMRGIREEDTPAQNMAAWGLANLATAYTPEPAARAAAVALLEPLRNETASCMLLDNERLREITVATSAETTLRLLHA